jgi:hypothetical protein
MDYRSSRRLSARPKVLRLPSTAWTSLYIPYLDSSYARDDIIDMFEHKYFIGIVSRIDVVKPRPKHTVSLNSKEWVSVFVHFECWYDNEFTYFLREHLEKHEKYDMRNYMEFVPSTRRKFQPDHFQVLINQSNGQYANGPPARYDTRSPLARDDMRPRYNDRPPISSADAEAYYSETMLKQQKCIELLQEEINSLRDLMVAKS